MLVHTMTNAEIVKQLQPEQAKIIDLIKSRFAPDYTKYRRQYKVKAESVYPKYYKTKLSSKNLWTAVLCKAGAVEKFKDQDSLSFSIYTHYYNETGLRVFKFRGLYKWEGMNIYNGHFFERYNERLELGINKPLEIVDHYFGHNDDSYGKILDPETVVNFHRDGMSICGLDQTKSFVTFKTFISKGMQFREQDGLKSELIESLANEIKEKLIQPDFNEVEYFYMADVYKSITS